MTPDSHKRVAGMHVTKTGDVALVWLSISPETKNIHIYDTALFKIEIPIVIAESINARGRFIPIAWSHEMMKTQLAERGCRFLPDKADDSNEMAEMQARELQERIRTRRITVDKHLKNWIEESKSFERQDGIIPKDSHPLMAATRNAMQFLRNARAQGRKHHSMKQKRQIAIV